MPRGPRILPNAGLFHLIGRGNNSVVLFRHRTDFLHFKSTLLRFMPEDICAIHHYAIMNTHFHLLSWVEQTSQLASLMKSVLISYQHYYRRKYEYKGHLWHSRFRSIHIASEEQWLQCARYIELNPVHAGLCRDPKGYSWTSYHFHAFGKEDSLVHLMQYPSDANKWKKGTENVDYRKFVLDGINFDYQQQKKQFERELFKCK